MRSRGWLPREVRESSPGFGGRSSGGRGAHPDVRACVEERGRSQRPGGEGASNSIERAITIRPPCEKCDGLLKRNPKYVHDNEAAMLLHSSENGMVVRCHIHEFSL